MLLLLLLLVFVISFSLVYLFYQWHVIEGILLEGLLIASTIAQKDLKRASLPVLKPLREKNIAEARKQLSFIVGRYTERLSEQVMIRVTVETFAQNSSDGIRAPVVWALIGRTAVTRVA